MSLNYSKLLSDSKYDKVITIDNFECDDNNFNIIKELKEDDITDDLDCLNNDYPNKTYHTFYGLLDYFFVPK